MKLLDVLLCNVVGIGMSYRRILIFPLILSVGKSISVNNVDEAIKRFREFIGEDTTIKVIDYEIIKALNMDADFLPLDFYFLVQDFRSRVILPMIKFSNILKSNDKNILKIAKEIMENIAMGIAERIELSRSRYADDLIYALSILIDRDIWFIDKVLELGIINLADKLITRALYFLDDFVEFSIRLAFTWVSATVSILGIAREFKDKNISILASYSREYADRVEEYLDVLDMLIDDDVYKDLIKLGIVER